MYANLQEVFDTAAKHLITQGRPAVPEDGEEALRAPSRCLYRTAAGLKCAVGCLIPDTHYDPEIEGGGVLSILEAVRANDLAVLPSNSRALSNVLGELGLMDERALDLLYALQRMHDSYADDSGRIDWREGLARVADQFGLGTSALTAQA